MIRRVMMCRVMMCRVMMCRVMMLGLGLVFALIDAAFAGFAPPTEVILPEPASMAVLATGVAALAIYRMRRRK